MDQHQNAAREKTIANALRSADNYLARYPGRTVSLLLANTLTISHIVALNSHDGLARVEAKVINDGASKTVTVSFHDITAVSEDDADLVTDETQLLRSKDIFNFVMKKFDAGSGSPLFAEVRDDMLAVMAHDFNMQFDAMDNRMKAAFERNLRSKVAQRVSNIIMFAYRPLIDFAEMEARALAEIGLDKVRTVTSTDDFILAMTG